MKIASRTKTLTKMATNHSLCLQRPKQFHQTGKCTEVGGLTQASLNHHHLLLNERVCNYLSMLKNAIKKALSANHVHTVESIVMSTNLLTTKEVTLWN